MKQLTEEVKAERISRPERLVRILESLNAGEPCNAKHFAEAFGVSRRTIHRDLGSLRKAGVSYQYDYASGNLQLTKLKLNAPKLPLATLLTLCACALTSPLYSHWPPGVDEAIGALKSKLPREDQELIESLTNRISKPRSTKQQGADATLWYVINSIARAQEHFSNTAKTNGNQDDFGFVPLSILANHASSDVRVQCLDLSQGQMVELEIGQLKSRFAKTP